MGNYGEFSGVPNPDPTTNTVMPILNDQYSTAGVRKNLLEGLDKIEAGNWTPELLHKNFASVNLMMIMPIFTGGKIIAANRAAQINIEEADVEIREAKYKAIKDLLVKYYGLKLAKNLEELRENAKTTIGKHLEDAKNMMEQGLIAKSDYLQVKLYMAQSKRELKKAKQQCLIANKALCNIMFGKDNNKKNEIIIPASNMFYNKSLKSLDEYIKNGKANNIYLAKKLKSF